ncbi:MAG: hypothetical protein IT581_15295 [Verrucomicrobiales bacterium]|nr:hypothetical protein [Verrucomicrobiales bacterium]
MQLSRFPHDPGVLAEFFTDGLGALGGVVERSWHDRLDVIAEGPSARLWNPDGAWHETELRLLPLDSVGQRDAAKDVFPGSPLTFRLAELLVAPPATLERIVLEPEPGAQRRPALDVLERLWQAQFPETHRFHVDSEPRPTSHFSLVGLVRCEVQAIDQHWSAHRLAVALADGECDESLAESLVYARPAKAGASEVPWPQPDPGRVADVLRRALELDLAKTLAAIRQRQERHLHRELQRIESYFAGYESELSQRRTRGPEAGVRKEQRLAAARVERERRRHDQIARHGVRVIPHLDGLLLVAETAWSATIEATRNRAAHSQLAVFVPRNRRWHLLS